MVKVSIIIPTYNHARELMKCLDTIKRQTFTDYEIIVVDDGSTDTTQKLLAARVTPAFRIIKTKNRDAAAARNTGFDQSKGAYILFCDADVKLMPQMLERMTGLLDAEPGIAFVYSSFKWGWKIMRALPFDQKKLQKFNYVDTVSLLRREYFPRFDESLQRFQDWDLWLSIVRHGGKGKGIDEVLFKKSGKSGRKSAWYPAFVYRFFPFLGAVKRYNTAREIIRKKHRIA